MKLSILDHIAFLLVVVGSVNWGLLALFKFNIVTTLFGQMPAVANAVYIAIGVSGVYMLLHWKKACSK